MDVNMIRRMAAAIAAALVIVYGSLSALAQSQATGPAAVEEAPPQVHALLKLLDDPAVRQWLERQRAADSAAITPPTAAATPTLAADNMVTDYFVARITAIRQHIGALVTTLPDLPAQFDRAFLILNLEFRDRGLIGLLLLVAAFVALGFGTEWLFERVTWRARARIGELPLDTESERLRAMVTRLAFTVGQLTVFAIGSIGAFLVFDWPPLMREIVLGYLLAFLALRAALVVGRFVLAPPDKLFRDSERFRILPMSRDAAWFWDRRLALLVGWFAFGRVTVELLTTLGVRVRARSPGTGHLCPWPGTARHRHRDRLARGCGERGHGGNGAANRPRRVAAYGLFRGAVAALGRRSDPSLLWLSIVAVALPAAMRVTQRAINHVLRPPGAADAAEAPGVLTVCLERGARVVLIIGAALLLAWAWHSDLVGMAKQDLLSTRLLRGALNVVVIALVADFAWHVVKALIDRKLIEAQDPALPDTAEGRRLVRLRTLLPVLTNLLFVTLLAVTVLMALSAMGIEIGPLIAGAGVVGVAIGFGAQTLVKDIISGMFYLLDDAFRIGEYIQSGNYKGTVESFSLRSVKLRHHRGPLYTVPFGVLGAVENMSRDWVIDKLQIGVTYVSIRRGS